MTTGKSQTMKVAISQGMPWMLWLMSATRCLGMAAVRKNRSSIQTGQPGTNIPVEWGGDWKTLKDGPHFHYHTEPIRHEALAHAWRRFPLITSMRLSWSLGRENARNEARPAP